LHRKRQQRRVNVRSIEEAGMDIRTKDGELEAYVFERDIGPEGIDSLKGTFAGTPGVRFVGQFVGAFTLFARVVAADLSELQGRIGGEYWEAGIRSDWSLNLTADRLAAPKRASPEICALVCARVDDDPFAVLGRLDERFLEEGAYGAAVVTARDFDLLVDLGADTVEEVIDRVLALRSVNGIGRTATAVADLADNAIRPTQT
jgi:hypothetical protein